MAKIFSASPRFRASPFSWSSPGKSEEPKNPATPNDWKEWREQILPDLLAEKAVPKPAPKVEMPMAPAPQTARRYLLSYDVIA
jgi:hypothetical protein